MAENNVPSYATAFFYRLSADLSPHLLHQGNCKMASNTSLSAVYTAPQATETFEHVISTTTGTL
jgi:hypothetical protein